MNNFDLKQLVDLIPILLPVLLIQLGLQVYGIVNLVKRERVRFDNKLIWALIIIAGGIWGTIAYLLFRGEE